MNVVLKRGDTGNYANLSERFFKFRSVVVIFSPEEADRFEIERKQEYGEIKEGDWYQPDRNKVIQCLSETDRGKRFYKTFWVKNRPFEYGIGRFNLNKLRGSNLTENKVAFFIGVNLPSSPYFGKPVELVVDLLKKGNHGKPSMMKVRTIFEESWYLKILNLELGKVVMENLDQAIEKGTVTWQEVLENYKNVATDKTHKDVILANDRLVALLKDKESRDIRNVQEKQIEHSLKKDIEAGEKATMGYISATDNNYENEGITEDEFVEQLKTEE